MYKGKEIVLHINMGRIKKFCLISALIKTILIFYRKKWEIVIDCRKLFLYLHRSNKKQKKNNNKMTIYYLHTTTTLGMGHMTTTMSTSTTMTPRG